MNLIHVGKNVYLNTDEIQYFCPSEQAPPELVSKAVDLSGSRRTLVVTKNKALLLIDITVETLFKRVQKAVRDGEAGHDE